MTTTEAISETAPSPWWPCPQCGGIYFRTICVFERGEWAEDGSYRHHVPPSATPQGIDSSDVECVDCEHRFDIAGHYEWPVEGEYEG